MHSFSARAFSTSDLVIRQADQTAALITVAEKDILYNCEGHSWAHMDPEHVDKVSPLPSPLLAPLLLPLRSFLPGGSSCFRA